jgi:hypothetical protein
MLSLSPFQQMLMRYPRDAVTTTLHFILNSSFTVIIAFNTRYPGAAEKGVLNKTQTYNMMVDANGLGLWPMAGLKPHVKIPVLVIIVNKPLEKVISIHKISTINRICKDGCLLGCCTMKEVY